ncbi:hypothetical protein CK503_09485 [Aliifodinibius salipaludis]|uniref:Uncharacterized protein n=1 Tax=Fodinibius salipaludis TaxID=2032627 RepID=A0A2A2GA64_9BACT|nr:hypothetical protein [Aliifodinibius salipaludis]PAU93894.1 hypothetical protein CK503_09485 [Aliifodinibius salipaludis]
MKFSLYYVIECKVSKEMEAVMIRGMFSYRAKNKKFKYQYRYYDPEKEMDRRERIKIRRTRKKYHQGRSVMMYAVGLSLVIYIMYLL